jgi:hypothetical protein
MEVASVALTPRPAAGATAAFPAPRWMGAGGNQTLLRTSQRIKLGFPLDKFGLACRQSGTFLCEFGFAI